MTFLPAIEILSVGCKTNQYVVLIIFTLTSPNSYMEENLESGQAQNGKHYSEML